MTSSSCREKNRENKNRLDYYCSFDKHDVVNRNRSFPIRLLDTRYVSLRTHHRTRILSIHTVVVAIFVRPIRFGVFQLRPVMSGRKRDRDRNARQRIKKNNNVRLKKKRADILWATLVGGGGGGSREGSADTGEINLQMYATVEGRERKTIVESCFSPVAGATQKSKTINKRNTNNETDNAEACFRVCPTIRKKKKKQRKSKKWPILMHRLDPKCFRLSALHSNVEK